MSVVSKLAIMGAAGAGGGEYWIALLGGTGSDLFFSGGADDADNIFAVGRTNSVGAGNYDALITKYSPSGSLEWARTLGTSSTEHARGGAVDASGNVVIAGYSSSTNSGDAYTAKYNSSGVYQWHAGLRNTSSLQSDQGYAVAVDASDNIVIAGITNGDCLTAKYNSSGTLQWYRRLYGGSGDQVNGVAVDASDNIVIAGATGSSGSGNFDFLIAKYNSSGTLQWQRVLGTSGYDFCEAVAVDAADNIIAVGFTNSDGAGSYDCLIAKYNSSGTLQWARTLGTTGDDRGKGVAVDTSDNIIVVGTTPEGAGGGDIFIAKYNSSGTLQWSRTLGGTGTEAVYGVATDLADNIIVFGTTTSDGSGGFDALLAKLPPDGSLTGTHGAFVYQDVTMTDDAAVLTDQAGTLTDAASSVSAVSIALTDAAAVLTDELISL